MNKEELLKEFNDKVEELKQEFLEKLEQEDVKEKKSFEVELLDDGEDIYFIDDEDNEIYKREFDKFNIDDKYCYSNGSYFLTKEEAEQHLKEQRLLFKIKKWAEIHNAGWEPDWSEYSENKFTIYYDGEDRILRIGAGSICNNILILPVFKTRGIAQACIDEFGKEIKEVLC